MTKYKALLQALEYIEAMRLAGVHGAVVAPEKTILTKSLIADLHEALTQLDPVQCLDCGSSNIGVPATYDSVIDSVKLNHIAGVGKMVVEPITCDCWNPYAHDQCTRKAGCKIEKKMSSPPHRLTLTDDEALDLLPTNTSMSRNDALLWVLRATERAHNIKGQA